MLSWQGKIGPNKLRVSQDLASPIRWQENNRWVESAIQPFTGQQALYAKATK